MAELINRMLIYITILLFIILSLNYAPDLSVAGWVTGYALIGVFLLTGYFALRGILNNWQSLMMLAGQVQQVGITLWQRFKQDTFGDVYVMSFFIGALGIGIITLELNGISSAVSQSFGILAPARESLFTLLYGAIAIIVGMLIVMLPERRTPYYIAVTQILVYGGFQFLNTSQRAVSGRGLLATLIVLMAAYFAFKNVISQDIAIQTKKEVRKSAVQLKAANMIIERYRGGYGNDTESTD